jgi:hypothetical protein
MVMASRIEELAAGRGGGGLTNRVLVDDRRVRASVPPSVLDTFPLVLINTEIAKRARAKGLDPRHLQHGDQQEILADIAAHPPTLPASAPFPPRQPKPPKNFTKDGWLSTSDGISGGSAR